MSCPELRGSFVKSARGYIQADFRSQAAVEKLAPRRTRTLGFGIENPCRFKCLEPDEFKGSRCFRHDFDLVVSDFRDRESSLDRPVQLESEHAVRAREALGRG